MARSRRTDKSYRATRSLGRYNWPVQGSAHVSQIDRRAVSVYLRHVWMIENTSSLCTITRVWHIDRRSASVELRHVWTAQYNRTMLLCASIHFPQIDQRAASVYFRHVWTIEYTSTDAASRSIFKTFGRQSTQRRFARQHTCGKSTDAQHWSICDSRGWYSLQRRFSRQQFFRNLIDAQHRSIFDTCGQYSTLILPSAWIHMSHIDRRVASVDL